MKQLFKGQISCKAVFSKQAGDSYYHGILATTDITGNVAPRPNLLTILPWQLKIDYSSFTLYLPFCGLSL